MASSKKTVLVEKFVPIKDHPDYEVGDLGTVRRLTDGMGGRSKAGQVIVPTENGHGYLQVGLRSPGRAKRMVLVHTLVARAFLPDPESPSMIATLKGAKSDVSVKNIEYLPRGVAIQRGIARSSRNVSQSGRRSRSGPSSRSARGVVAGDAVGVPVLPRTARAGKRQEKAAR